jgi:DNA polymerase-3 subunit gamma/tau
LGEGEPCNNCPSCIDILSGQSLDVIEIDGASNRGIDDIRQINETVGFAPSHGKYKIYIIDEVHMLTKEAFNALLKTLEEPPERAKFFFATTEPHKVLPTILSRCQRFDLGRISPPQIIAKLTSIAKDLNREVESEAIQLLAQYADGSLRDAESLFDQILCFSDAHITATDVRNALGLLPQELFFALDKAFADQRLAAAFELVDELFSAGKDLGHFLAMLIEHYRHIAVAKTRGEAALALLGFGQSLVTRYAAAAALYSQPQSLAILDLLLKADAQISRSASPRVALELTLLQVLRTKNRIPIEALVRRLSEIEERLIEQQNELRPPCPEAQEMIGAVHPLPEAPTEAPSKPLHEAAPEVPTAPSLPEIAAKIELPTQGPVAAAVESEPMAPPHLEEPMRIDPPAELRAVPFSPYKAKSEVKQPEAKLETEQAAAPPPKPPPPAPSDSTPQSPSKHPSHYATLMRFAAIELEGTIKN